MVKMTTLIYMLLPSLVGTKIYMKLNNKELNIKIILDYLAMCLFTNIFATGIMFYLVRPDKSIEEALKNIPFSLKYAVIAIIMSVFLSIIASIINKNFEFNIRINERKTKKNKSR